MYQVSLKSEGVRPFFMITWPGITQMQTLDIGKVLVLLCHSLGP